MKILIKILLFKYQESIYIYCFYFLFLLLHMKIFI